MSLSTSSATPAPIMTKADLEKDTITASRPFKADLKDKWRSDYKGGV